MIQDINFRTESKELNNGIKLLNGEYKEPPFYIEGLPNKNEYMAQLYSREAYDLSLNELSAISNSKIAILGVGSVGGRLGIELSAIGAGTNAYVRVVDKETYDISNLNRQPANWKDVVSKKPKASVVKENMLGKNPFSHIITHDNGIKIEEIRSIVEDADIVIWGLDDPQYAWEIHSQAKDLGKVVFSGLDLGHWAMFRYWDYRNKDTEIFDGLISQDMLGSLNKVQFLAKGIHNVEENLPVSLLKNIRDIALRSSELNNIQNALKEDPNNNSIIEKRNYLIEHIFFSQTNTAAGVFSSWGSKLVAKVLANPSGESGVQTQSIIKCDYQTLKASEVEKIENERKELLKDPIIRYMLCI